MQGLAEIHQRLASERDAMTVAIGGKWTIRGHLRTGANDPSGHVDRPKEHLKIVIG